MSRQELERKLTERGASQAEARYAAEWLEAIGAIDDRDYAALLARHHDTALLGLGALAAQARASSQSSTSL